MKKLLFIRYKINDGIKEGGDLLSQTNLNLIKSLFGEDQVFEFAVHDKKQKSGITKKIIGSFYFFKSMHYGITPSKLAAIEKLARQYDYVYIDRSIFGIIAKYLRQKKYQGQIIVFFHNYEPYYFRDSISNFNPLKSVILKCVQKNEEWSCQYADQIIALNQRDNALLLKHYCRKADLLIPVSLKDNYVPDAEIKTKKCETPLTALFFGSYFPANSDGILWFIKEVLPNVNIKLQIVGKNMNLLSSKIKDQSKIELHGSVPTLKPFLENADVLILPIFKGSGMKVKTCEAMMYGKSIIGGREAFEGYDVDFQKIGALANQKEEFIQALEQFAAASHYKFNEYARDFYLKNHSEEATLNKFKQLFDFN